MSAMLAWIIPVIAPGSGGERPEHPIYYPPGIWGPPDMPPGFWGGGMGPGGPYPPAGRPEHPIYHPPGIWGPPTMPPGFWGGGMGPGVRPPSGPVDPGFGNPAFDDRPNQPINKPPGDNPNWGNVYIPGVGWVWAIVPGKPGQGGPPPEQAEEKPAESA